VRRARKKGEGGTGRKERLRRGAASPGRRSKGQARCAQWARSIRASWCSVVGFHRAMHNGGSAAQEPSRYRRKGGGAPPALTARRSGVQAAAGALSRLRPYTVVGLWAFARAGARGPGSSSAPQRGTGRGGPGLCAGRAWEHKGRAQSVGARPKLEGAAGGPAERGPAAGGGGQRGELALWEARARNPGLYSPTREGTQRPPPKTHSPTDGPRAHAAPPAGLAAALIEKGGGRRQARGGRRVGCRAWAPAAAPAGAAASPPPTRGH
jgi:hypothetical protein